MSPKEAIIQWVCCFRIAPKCNTVNPVCKHQCTIVGSNGIARNVSLDSNQIYRVIRMLPSEKVDHPLDVSHFKACLQNQGVKLLSEKDAVKLLTLCAMK